MQGFLGFVPLLPLDGAGGLRGQIVENPVDALHFMGDALGDVLQQGERHIFYGGRHGVLGIVELEQTAHKNDRDGKLHRIDVMEEKWSDILQLLNGLPSSEEVMALLRSLDAPYLPEHIDVDKQLLKNTFLYCKEVRNRYTILQMLWDLDLLEPLAEEVIAEVSALYGAEQNT